MVEDSSAALQGLPTNTKPTSDLTTIIATGPGTSPEIDTDLQSKAKTPPPLPKARVLQPAPPATNRERLELILELMKQPLKVGDIWFATPQRWFENWVKMCEARPDDVKVSVGQMNTSELRHVWKAWFGGGDPLLNNPECGKMFIPEPAWDKLQGW